ncbi:MULTISPECIES: hypothetical protein [Inquilinus]|jgi:hypothetical protein|uniref:Uncharacterized protein n=1 Tax=Inquilinus ginsengisoli TaxID=363840 RepID=A0ABU1JM71_9PROT|nr:hypothetical protein [Inquilinus ginsengisoli]MDR6289448.1 hypothetical protein [Inquilinus ginsengisoli]
MTMRTITTTAVFAHPFVLSGIDGVQPPGSYEVETDEEWIDGTSPPAYRRIATMIRLAGRPGTGETVQVVAVDPDELAAALVRDAAGAVANPPSPGSSTAIPAGEGASAEPRPQVPSGPTATPQPERRFLDGWRDWLAVNPHALAWIAAIAGGVVLAAFVVAW